MNLGFWRFVHCVVLFLGTLTSVCCKSDPSVVFDDQSKTMAIKITSSRFAEGQPIPPRYTCDDANVSPPLSFSQVPETTKSLALICDDPDAPAGTWVHWVLYDLAPTIKQLPESIEARDQVLDGAKQGKNDFQKIGYGGPCPPKGAPHRYYFKIYALDKNLALEAGATKDDVEQAMKGHVIAEGKLMGTYMRK